MNFVIIFILAILICIAAPFFAQIHLYTIIDFIKYKSRKKIIEYLDLDIEYVGKVMYVTYFRESEKFRIAAPIKPGIRSIKNIEVKYIVDPENTLLKQNGTDFAANLKLKEFAGPHRDFHGIPTTPNMLGIDQPIIITYYNNVVREYVGNEIIEIKPPEQK
jgi:hypothetical protein